MAAQPLNLLHLTPDLIRAIAHFLPPRDRFNFSLTNRRLNAEAWDQSAFEDLTSRFPVEYRTQFPLQVLLSTAQPPPQPPHHHPPLTDDERTLGNRRKSFRIVPNRSRQQHVAIAVSASAALIAVLPYDNILRIIAMPNRQLLSSHQLAPPYENDIWDIDKGRPKSTPRSLNAAYADDAGLDVQVLLDFSPDQTKILVSGPTVLSLYTLRNGGKTVSLWKQFSIDHVLPAILGDVDHSRAVGGAAALSPDGKSIAWVVYARNPALAFITFWDVRSATFRAMGEVAAIHPRRWSSLGWARVVYAPNSLYCAVVVNAAEKKAVVDHVDNEYRQVKLCRFEVAVYEASRYSSTARRGAIRDVEAMRRAPPQWLNLGNEEYPRMLSCAVANMLDGLRLFETGHAYGTEAVDLSETQQMRGASIALNSVHSCPSEATYMGLSFGSSTRHPWFVSKQPMFSMHFGMDGSRIQVATSQHANTMETLVRRKGLWWESGADEMMFAMQGAEVRGHQRHAFKMMPWRASFASVTALSSTGKWLVGASLLDDDQCCVCLRNVTVADYFD